MKIEVEIPEGVNVEINNNVITVSGKEGSVTKEIKSKLVKMKKDSNKVVLETENDRKKSFAQINTVKKIINNLMSGVQKKFKYKLKVIYSHFPMTVSLKGKELHINNFAGGKKPIIVKIADNVNVEVKGRDITVSSVDKETAGIVAGLIEKSAVIKNRDRRVFQDGIYIVEKGVQDE